MTEPTAFERAIEWLGHRVVAGELAAGETLSVEDLVEATGTSRSVAREATRVLAALGIIQPRQRVGLTVLPQNRWAMLEPRVVRWRLEVGDRAAQLRELAELRLAIEPAAARLAAERISETDARQLVALGASLRLAATTDALLRADQDFHRLLIAASNNALFARVTSVIEEALRHHTLQGPGGTPVPEDLELHAALAASVAAGQRADAERLAREIVRRTAA